MPPTFHPVVPAVLDTFQGYSGFPLHTLGLTLSILLAVRLHIIHQEASLVVPSPDSVAPRTLPQSILFLWMCPAYGMGKQCGFLCLEEEQQAMRERRVFSSSLDCNLHKIRLLNLGESSTVLLPQEYMHIIYHQKENYTGLNICELSFLSSYHMVESRLWMTSLVFDPSLSI